jgi:hypothetical protein
MGLNPMILRQAQTFAFLFSPWRAPPAARHPYRASGLVLAQIADIRRRLGVGPNHPELSFAPRGKIWPKLAESGRAAFGCRTAIC